MNLTFSFLSFNALTTKSVVMTSLKFPICMVPEGVMPEAQTYLFFCPPALLNLSFIILSAIASAQKNFSIIHKEKYCL